MNEWMVRQGWAINFEPYAKRRYLAAQRDAETNRRGIWKGCFAAPGDIRHWKKSAPLMGSPCSPDARARIFREDACSMGVEESDDVEFFGFVCGFGAGFELQTPAPQSVRPLVA